MNKHTRRRNQHDQWCSGVWQYGMLYDINAHSMLFTIQLYYMMTDIRDVCCMALLYCIYIKSMHAIKTYYIAQVYDMLCSKVLHNMLNSYISPTLYSLSTVMGFSILRSTGSAI